MKLTIDDLKKIQNETYKNVSLDSKDHDKIRVVVGMATCGIAAGATPVYEAIKKEIEAKGLKDKVSLAKVGCIGICQYEPIVEVTMPGEEKVTYIKMDADKAKEVVDSHIQNHKAVGKYTFSGTDEVKYLKDMTFFNKQYRIALRNCGIIDPENIDEYIGTEGYQALYKVLTSMKSEDVVNTLLNAGLRGRGGAGFPTGRKWAMAAANKADQKYVCCNADEGDPGAFMDRSVLESDPHVVLEAMAIAGYTIGASKGYIYVRAEYPNAVDRLNKAIKDAKAYGLLGDNIFGTNFSFDIELRLGAGAFVCGEETALMTSIEGKRGEPHPRPPFPAVKGLFEKPTILNNVETWANVPRIIMKGDKWFSSIGTEKSKGTKVFALGGKINNTGLVEIPMGTTLKTIIEEIGGGIPNGKKFKAAQTGGPSGGCISMENYNVPIDYDNLIAIGSMMGSGGLIVMDETTCMVDIAKFFLQFTVEESCGKCTPCRIGNKRLYELLEKITEGKATMEDMNKIEELSAYIKDNSLCGLGQTAPNPVLSTMRYFKDEYIEHIKDHKCKAGVCKSMLAYKIDPSKCVGCTMCAKNCPANAINGELKQPHTIDQSKCIKCGTCLTTCKVGAISVG